VRRQVISKIMRRTIQVLIAIIYFIPFYWMILKSFRESIFPHFPPNLLPLVDTISNYIYVWRFGAFPLWYLNSVIIAITTTAGSVFIGALAGYAFARLEFKGRDVLFYIVLATLMIPFPVITVAEYIMMVDIHWVNTYQAVIIPSMVSAVNIFLMRQYFTTIPTEVEEAARIDGLKTHQIFLRIAAPLAKPAFAAAAIYTFLSAWNSFLWPLFVLQTPNHFTLPLAINFFKGANGVQIYWNQMTAAEVLSLLPTLIIYIVFERYFIRGIAINVNKG